MTECPICQTVLEGTILQSLSEWTFECPRCGSVCIHGQSMLFGTALGRVFLNLPDLTALRRRSQASHILRRQARPNQLTVVSVQAITEWPLHNPLPSVLEQMDDLIRWTGTEQITPDTPARIKHLALSAYLGTLINPAADLRSDAALDEGDLENHQLWLDIMRAVDELQRIKRNGGEHLN